MAISNLTRRSVFALPAFLLVPLSSCSEVIEQQEGSAHDTESLNVIALFVKRLFPIKGVSSPSFTAIAKSLLENPDLDTPIDAALKALSSASTGDWLNADDATQIQIMRTLESQTWFVTLFILSRALLFDRPDVWSAIGYDGPSLEFEGYKYRGFNDIDWLPKGDP